MKILKLYFYLLVCCGAAEGFTEKSVDLGQNVTLKCEVSVKDVLWFLMKPSEPPIYLLRSFASVSTTAEYSNSTFNKTFSLQYNSSLFIHNISTNELGVYYCIKTGSPSNISSGIRLYSQNHSAVTQMCEKLKDEDVRLWRSLFIALGVINCLVVIVVVPTGFTVCRRKRCPNTPARPSDADLQPRLNNTIPVYEEVQYTQTDQSVSILNETYTLLHLPNL